MSNQIWTRPYLLIQRVVSSITSVEMEVSVFPRNLVSHGTFKGLAVDQRYSELLGVFGEVVTSELLRQMTLTTFRFIGSRESDTPHAYISRPTLSLSWSFYTTFARLFFYFAKSNTLPPPVDLIFLLILSIYMTLILSYSSLHVHYLTFLIFPLKMRWFISTTPNRTRGQLSTCMKEDGPPWPTRRQSEYLLDHWEEPGLPPQWGSTDLEQE